MNNLKLGVVIRNSLVRKSHPKASSLFPRWYSSKNNDNKSDEADKKEVAIDDDKSEVVRDKLNRLLKEMIELPTKQTSEIKLKLAKPVFKPKKEKLSVESSGKVVDEKSNEKNAVETAVKDVAESIGGDVKQTESELMKKLLNLETDPANESSPALTLGEVFKNMKIDRRQSSSVEQKSRSDQVRQLLKQSKRQPQDKYPPTQRTRQPKQRQPVTVMEDIDLFGKEPLGIFTADPNDYKEGVKNETWDYLKQREMKLAITHPPSNYFQQMILWTEQGKVWKFPIDNEQGLEEEQKVSFADHIFLEKHLDSWCPTKGPIRHFMELVCVGLSKNHHLTVAAKIGHIEWYRNYFEDKRQVLKEVGADFVDVKKIGTADTK